MPLKAFASKIIDQPYYKIPEQNTGKMLDILNVGKECDIFKLKKESLIKNIPVNISDKNNNNLFHLILQDKLKKTQASVDSLNKSSLILRLFTLSKDFVIGLSSKQVMRETFIKAPAISLKFSGPEFSK